MKTRSGLSMTNSEQLKQVQHALERDRRRAIEQVARDVESGMTRGDILMIYGVETGARMIRWAVQARAVAEFEEGFLAHRCWLLPTDLEKETEENPTRRFTREELRKIRREIQKFKNPNTLSFKGHDSQSNYRLWTGPAELCLLAKAKANEKLKLAHCRPNGKTGTYLLVIRDDEAIPAWAATAPLEAPVEFTEPVDALFEEILAEQEEARRVERVERERAASVARVADIREEAIKRQSGRVLRAV